MNNQENNSYRNIITEDEYDNLSESEKYDFLIEKEVYNKRNEKEIKKEHIEYIDKKKTWFLERYFSVNPIIIDDVISKYLKIDNDYSDIKYQIEIDIYHSPDVYETLKSYNTKYIGNLKESPLDYQLFYSQKGILDKKELRVFIKDYISIYNLSNWIIIYYIAGKELPLDYYPPFSTINEVIRSMEILGIIRAHFQGEKDYSGVINRGKLNKEGQPQRIKPFPSFFNDSNKKHSWNIRDKFKNLSNKNVSYLMKILGEKEILVNYKEIQFVRSLRGSDVTASAQNSISKFTRDFDPDKDCKNEDYISIKSDLENIINPRT